MADALLSAPSFWEPHPNAIATTTIAHEIFRMPEPPRDDLAMVHNVCLCRPTSRARNLTSFLGSNHEAWDHPGWETAHRSAGLCLRLVGDTPKPSHKAHAMSRSG